MASQPAETRVLVVDDAPHIRECICTYLSDIGYGTLEAADGTSALEVIEAEKPDLVLLELRMPGLDGMEVLSNVAETYPNLPAIIISGGGGIDDAVEVLKLGAWDYLVKPIHDMSMLQSAVARALRKAQRCAEADRREERTNRLLTARTLALRSKTEEHRRTSAALRSAEEKYRAVFRQLGVGVVRFDTSGRLGLANKRFREMGQYEWDELTGRAVIGLVHPDDRRKGLRCVCGLLAGKMQTAVLEVRLCRADGNWFWANCCVSAVRFETGGIEHLLCIVQDVTRHKEAEAEARLRKRQLERADKLASLGTLLASVAHEINTPNSCISMNLGVLGRAWNEILPILDQHAEGDRDFRIAGVPYDKMRDGIFELMDGIDQGSLRISRTIRDLKSYARDEEAVMDELVRMDHAVGAAVSLTKSLIRSSRAKVEVDCAHTLPTVTGNLQRIEQVVVNLIQNACHALPPEGGLIRIAVSAGAASIHLSIEDTGCGICESDLEQVFDPFYTTRRMSGGTGLGLSISQSIIEEHGGALEISSTVNVGTTILIQLPVSGVEA